MVIVLTLFALLIGFILGIFTTHANGNVILRFFKSTFAKFANSLLPGKPLKESVNSVEDEFREMVDQASSRGLMEESEREMIHSVFDLGETMVRELMVPRTEMVWIDGSKTLRQGLSLALKSGFTRIPVITDNLDDVIGIAYVKDLAKRVHENRDAENSETVEQNIRKANFVPETKMAADLLKEMQRDQIHMSVVIDEYGGTAGLITIEDILEEIVGEIADEYDSELEEVLWLSENTARVSARMHIEDFAKDFSVNIDGVDHENIDSLGGLMAQQLGRVPLPGSQITVGQWRLVAERPTGRRNRISTLFVERQLVNDQDS
jgi:CBS domain containing-hemolysin-like protein